MKGKNIFFAVAFLMLLYSSANAAEVLSVQDFYIDSNHDEASREKVETVLIKETSKLYFYIEKLWWNKQDQYLKGKTLHSLNELAKEFENKIYPILTSNFGNERNPGIDNDEKITIVFHNMKEGVSGYFRSVDGYYKIQIPSSNEREMLYLAIADIEDPNLKSRFAHEFVHLITFNQKNVLHDLEEEIWLNEARAEYAPSILGYESIYAVSDLRRRANDFLFNPSTSLTEWKSTKYDYAAVKLFMHYLVDHYGIDILSDSLKLKSFGIDSINKALSMNGFKEDFSQIFTDWTIANIVNDCSINKKYCYLDKNLAELRLNPPINFLPLSGDSSLSVRNSLKNWMANWQKIIGGNGDMIITFEGSPGLHYKLPYILFKKNGEESLHFMSLDKNQLGKIEVKDFGTHYSALVIIPSLQSKMYGFDDREEASYPYAFTVSFNADGQESPTLIQQLLAQIESLKKQIADLQSGSGGKVICASIVSNLYIGASNAEVKCLQQFLKSQDSSIYPEGLVTGYFGNLTKLAVARFQEKYKAEILIPLGLTKGTGFVGGSTKAKINQLLSL